MPKYTSIIHLNNLKYHPSKATRKTSPKEINSIHSKHEESIKFHLIPIKKNTHSIIIIQVNGKLETKTLLQKHIKTKEDQLTPSQSSIEPSALNYCNNFALRAQFLHRNSQSHSKPPKTFFGKAKSVIGCFIKDDSLRF